MDLIFDMNEAKKKMFTVLLRTKCENEQMLGKFPGMCEKIDNIKIVLGNAVLLEKLTVIQLVNDIDNILYLYEQKNNHIFPLKNLLNSSVSSDISLISGVGLSINSGSGKENELKKFSSSEDLRKYLYKLVGFVYQSKEEAVNMQWDDVTDPMVLCNYSSVNVLSILTDLNSIHKTLVPALVSPQKQK